MEEQTAFLLPTSTKRDIPTHTTRTDVRDPARRSREPYCWTDIATTSRQCRSRRIRINLRNERGEGRNTPGVPWGVCVCARAQCEFMDARMPKHVSREMMLITRGRVKFMSSSRYQDRYARMPQKESERSEFRM